MLIVLDTNVLISGQFKKRGNEAAILEYHRKGLFQLAVSEEIFQEYARVLHYPHIQARLHWTPERIAQFLADFRKIVVFVQVDEQESVSPDPHDDKFFHCAKAANADFLVSGDKRHVLPMVTYGTVRIIKPIAFLNVITSAQQGAA
ncbi:MAG TPA: putative toxin-antitoxin system toxin component, PIN family [Nitrososphaera sp.]|jgi:putative PIN family toxin of toxin-antitoxin system|nr:putative toxin-antitoxin system toxin component, PIN family [Nitrososphaera sp.]